MKNINFLKHLISQVVHPPVIQFLLIAVGFLMLASLAWNPPDSQANRSFSQTTPAPTGEAAEATPTFFDPRAPNLTQDEWENNYRQTDSIIFGGVLMVLVIVGGTLSAITSKSESKQF
jgi:hypothetical protein